MARYLLIVDFDGGRVSTSMDEWEPQEVTAHLDYYGRLHEELVASGELVDSTVLTGPAAAKVVRAGERGAQDAVVTDGPFTEFTEWVAGFQVVDVESEARALEIAALVSAVPGPGGRPTGQPIQVRRVMEDSPSDVEEMQEWMREGVGRS